MRAQKPAAEPLKGFRPAPYPAEPPKAEGDLGSKLDAIILELAQLRRMVVLGAYAQVVALCHLDRDLTKAAPGRRDAPLSLDSSWRSIFESLARHMDSVDEPSPPDGPLP